MLVRMRCAAGTPCFLPAPHTFHASHTCSASSSLSAGHMQRMRCGGGTSCSLPVSPHFPYLPHFHPLSGRMQLTCCAASSLCPPPAPCLSSVFHTFPISPCSAEHMQLTCCGACSPLVPSLSPELDLLTRTLSMHPTLFPTPLALQDTCSGRAAQPPRCAHQGGGADGNQPAEQQQPPPPQRHGECQCVGKVLKCGQVHAALKP